MTTLKVSSPAELISAVPFLIGFHPADSLTVVAMRGSRVAFAVRIDLPEHGTPDEEAKAAVLHLATVVLGKQVEAIAIIGYGDASRVTPAVQRISDAFRKAALTIVDELRVANGRYWSYLCTDLSCCPPEGRPCEPSNSVVAAEATFAGAVALPSREALEMQLAPTAGADREAMTTATARAMLRLAALASERLPPLPPPPSATGLPPDDSQPTGSAPSGGPALGGGPAPSGGPALGGGSVPAGGSPIAGGLESAGGSASANGSAPAAEQHDRREGQGSQRCSGDRPDPTRRRPGSAELHLGGMIEEVLGIIPPVLDEPDPVTDWAAPLSDEEYFLGRIRSAGRLAVREAERCYRAGGRLSDDDAAWLGVLLLHLPVRDYAWTRTRTQEWELALWSDLTRRVEPRYLPAPACLLAFVAWRSGFGPLASVAVDRALDQKPDYPMAVLLHHALLIGLLPSALDGWPAVDGMAPVDCSDSEAVGGCFTSQEDPGPDEAVSSGTEHGQEPSRLGRAHGQSGRPARAHGQESGRSGRAHGHDPDRLGKARGQEPDCPADGGREPDRAAEPGRDHGRLPAAEQEQTQSVGQEKPRQGEQGGKPPTRARSDAPPARSRDSAGGGPDRRELRRRKSQRAARRRF